MQPATRSDVGDHPAGLIQGMTSDLFRVSDEAIVSVIELALPDAIDSDEFDRLNESLLMLIGGKADRRWVLDLTDVAYAGSAALGLFVNIRQRVKQGNGRLVLCGLSTRLEEIFRTCCMERLFNIAKDRTEALRAAGR